MIHATVAIMHKSYEVPSIFAAMEEMSEKNEYLKKSMADTGLTKDYVEQFAGTLGDPANRGATQDWVNRAQKHHV